jgi:hypothetical protein
MKRAMLGLLLILMLFLVGQTLKRACELAGVPFLTITVLRDLSLVGLFIWALGSIHLLQAQRIGSALLLFFVLFSLYLFVSAFEGQLGIGLYYLRIYMLPLMFFIVAHAALTELDRNGMDTLLRSLLWLNAVMLVLAFALYAVVLMFPAQRPLVFGVSFLPPAWFVAGAGRSMMRMGLPMTGPNTLGVYFGLMSLVILFLIFWRGDRSKMRPAMFILAALDLVALVATFSRSSVLMLLVAFLSLGVIPAFRRSRTFPKAIAAGFLLLGLFACSLLVIEAVSNGFVSRWVELNLEFQDPSLRGHWQSLVDAYDHLEQYYLYGYPRGSVGPKALMFSVSHRFNVENGFLGVVYDFGLFGAIGFFAGYALLLAMGYRSSYQIPVLIGFFVSMQFLPYIFEPEVISLFLFVYLLIGQLDRLGYLRSLASTHGERSTVLHHAYRVAGSKAQ